MKIITKGNALSEKKSQSPKYNHQVKDTSFKIIVLAVKMSNSKKKAKGEQARTKRDKLQVKEKKRKERIKERKNKRKEKRKEKN